MSFVAATRQSLSSTARASLRNASSTFRAGARRMNSSHATYTPKSDKPWIIGSALLFGPAFLYLVSPSARKNTHFVHNDAHDFPGHKAHAPAPVTTEAVSEPEPQVAPEPEPEPVPAAQEPVLMKDGEGKEADIASSLAKSADDVPAADPVGHENVAEAAPTESPEPDVKETEPETEPSKAAEKEVEPKKAEESS